MRRTRRVCLALGLRAAFLEAQIWGTGNGCNGELRQGISLFENEGERTEIGNLQGNVSVPSSVDSWGGEMNQQPGSRPRAFRVDEANQLRVTLRAGQVRINLGRANYLL